MRVVTVKEHVANAIEEFFALIATGSWDF